MELELGLDPDEAAHLTRLKFLAPLKTGKARSRAVRIVWHDSPERALAQQGLALAEQRPQWRLERLLPNAASWPPGAPVPVIAAGRDIGELREPLPEPLIPMAALEGRTYSLSLATDQGPVGLTVLGGTVRTVTAEHRVCRVWLDGMPLAVQGLAVALAGELGIAVPRASLAAEALSIGTGRPPAARRQGAPDVPEGLSVAATFAHVLGHLSDVILHYAPAAAAGNDGPEPVHQMRVAVRRLRSAMKVFRQGMDCPAVQAADRGLKALAAKLGPTRDWDVFVTETVTQVTAAFPEEPRLQRLLATAERRRRTCHEELSEWLGSCDFRRLGIELACLAGGPIPPPAPSTGDEFTEPPQSLHEYAAHVLRKRHKRFAEIGDDLAGLAVAELHDIRLRAKRLRYAAEIFAPLYPGKAVQRFIRRLARLQDRLGALNDGAVAASLLSELGSSKHAFAAGFVLGFVGARRDGTRQEIEQAWAKFHRLTPFWE